MGITGRARKSFESAFSWSGEEAVVRLGTHPESPGHPSALVTGDVNNTQAMTAPLSLATSRTSRTPVEAHKQLTARCSVVESITFGLHCRCDAKVGCICMSEMMMMMEAQTENIEGMSVR